MKENKFTIIICMLSCLVLACGVYIALDVFDNTEDVQNNTTENNTRESIKTAYECKPLESEAPDEYIYETNDITLKLFNNNKNEFPISSKIFFYFHNLFVFFNIFTYIRLSDYFFYISRRFSFDFLIIVEVYILSPRHAK